MKIYLIYLSDRSMLASIADSYTSAVSKLSPEQLDMVVKLEVLPFQIL